MSNQIPLDYRTPADPKPRRRMSPVAKRRWFITAALFLLLVVIISAFSIQQERERVRQQLLSEQAERELAPHAWQFTIAAAANGHPFEFIIDMRSDEAVLRRQLRLYFFVIEREVAEQEKSSPPGRSFRHPLGTFRSTFPSHGVNWGPFDLVALNPSLDGHRYGVRRSGRSVTPADPDTTLAGVPDADDIDTLIDSIISNALDEWRMFEPTTRSGDRVVER